MVTVQTSRSSDADRAICDKHFHLSIITISRDDPDGLRRTLDSLNTQLVLPFQVILVRRGTSRNLELSSYTHLNCIEVPDPESGISPAFNAGLTAAKGAWVMFLNGGDALFCDRSVLSIQTNLAGEAAGADMVSAFALSSEQISVPHHSPRRLSDYLYLSHQATLFRRELFSEIGGYAPRFSIRMDLDWMARYLVSRGASRIRFIGESIVRYELDGISSRNWWTFYREEVCILVRYPEFYLRIARLLLIDVPARILSPHAWRRRLSRLVGLAASRKGR